MTYFEKIVDLSTGEEILRPYTVAETKAIEAEIETINKLAIEQAAKAHERSALLERLGITEEEARLLLGGN